MRESLTLARLFGSALNENPSGTTRAQISPERTRPPGFLSVCQAKTGDLVEKASERGLFICVVTLGGV